MKFELTAEEIKILNEWKKSLPEIPADVFGEKFQYTYKFHPTGLGIVKLVERDLDGAQIDLTNYSNW